MKQQLLPCRLSSVRRRAASVLETIVALVLFSLVLGIAAQLCGTMFQQRRIAAQQRQAVEAESNLMSLTMSLPYESITLERVTAMAEQLTVRSGEWKINVDGDDQDESKRVEIELTTPFARRYGGRDRPLVAWKYPHVAGENLP